VGNVNQGNASELSAKISDPHTPDYEALKAIETFPINGKESDTFWLKIINNKAFSENRRRLCMIQFFVRKVPGMTLKKLTQFPGVTSWFKADQINEVGTIIGGVPFKHPNFKNVIVILYPNLPANNKSSIWLQFNIAMGENDNICTRALLGKEMPPDSLIIVDVGAQDVATADANSVESHGYFSR
jgi:hypothetical protein